MSNPAGLQRFIDAQQRDYATALAEIKRGRKQSHWMWYIFPQIQGLGYSSTAQYYAIRNLQEAEAFIQHPTLSQHLIEICQALLALPSNDAHSIFGSPDDFKLRSSMTLFAAVKNAPPIFQSVLDKFFKGQPDSRTLQMLRTPN